MKLKTKLIAIFATITVIPVVILVLMIQDNSNNILLFVLGKLDKLSVYSNKSTKNISDIVMKDSLTSLDLKSKNHLENIAKSKAYEIANFLHSVDNDLLFLSNINIKSKKTLQKFYDKKTRKIIEPMEFEYYKEIGEWVADEIHMDNDHIITNSSKLNKEVITFHYYKDFDMVKKKIYKEITFIDLKGKEKIKVSSIDKKLKDISKQKNTYNGFENYFKDIQNLLEGEIYVSNIIGEYVGSKINGAFTQKNAKKIGIDFKPEEYAYAGIENPDGKKFDGIIRFVTPKYKNGKKIGYISLALDYVHIAEFLDYMSPQSQSNNNYSDASKGNIAFMWDNNLRMASHPRDYYISGFDKKTKKRVMPWLSSDVATQFRDSNKSWEAFSKNYPKYENQSTKKQADSHQLEKEGKIALECAFLNFSTQCVHLRDITRLSGYSSYSSIWMGMKQFSAIAIIPYHSGQYREKTIGFGAVVIQSNLKDFRKEIDKTQSTIDSINDLYQNQIQSLKSNINNAILVMIEDALSSLSFMAIIMIVFLIAIVAFVSTYLTRSIYKVINGVKEFKSYDYKKLGDKIEINSKDEISELADIFNEMASSIYELFTKQEELNKNLDYQVKMKTKKITRLLSNSDQGFLTFGRDLLIDKEYSKKCESILGVDNSDTNIAGKNISICLFSDSKKMKDFTDNIYAIFNSKNIIAVKALISLLPRELSINEKIVNIDYKLLESNYLMLIITDVTASKELNMKIQQEKFHLKMIVGVVKYSDLFLNLKKDFEYFAKHKVEYINNNQFHLHNINEIYRAVHTFKSMFAQFFMNDTASKLHNIESKLSDMLNTSAHTTNSDIIKIIEEIDFIEFMKSDLDDINKTLGDKYLQEDIMLQVPKETIVNIHKKYQNIISKHNIKTLLSEEVDSYFNSLFNKPLTTYLHYYPKMTIELSHRLNKEIHEFDIVGGNDIIVPETYKPFLYSLIHVFRNAIEHGIENPDRRYELKKDSKGVISCSLENKKNSFEITISDDGGGIDIEKLKEKISTKYLDKDMDTLSDSEIYAFIFEDQMSTKDEISEISGRGVGMGAVKAQLEKIHGEVEIKSKINIGTTFIFKIPLLMLNNL